MAKTTFKNTDVRDSISRVANDVAKIDQRKSNVRTGRYIPDQDTLTIGTGTNLHCSVLFLDICNFSAFDNDTFANQEGMLEAISLLFGELIRVIELYGGVVEKNTGDGLMAYFVDDASTSTKSGTVAVACGLALLYVSEHIVKPTCIRRGLNAFDFRICIDTGRLTIARVGAARRFNGIVAIGTTANIASKMLAFAEPNEMLIGLVTYLQLPEDWQPLAELTKHHTGFVFTKEEKPYPVIRYNGRWKP